MSISTSVEYPQNIEDIFEILKKPFFKDNLVHEDNLGTLESDRKKRLYDLYKKFKELSGGREVEFYNDFITKFWKYFSLQQQKIDDDPQSNQAKLIKSNIEEQLKILWRFKQFLIKKKILSESSNSISPSPNLIDSLLIPKKITRGSTNSLDFLFANDSTLLRSNSSIRSQNFQKISTTLDFNPSHNSAYLDSRSKIITHLDEMKRDSNPKDNLFFREYLLKHIELVDLYQKQNIYLKSDYSEKFNKYVIQARRNCLNHLLSIVNFSYFRGNEINFGKILPSKEINKYLYELRVLKYCLQNPNYNSKSKDKLDHFLTLEINRFSNKKITQALTNSPSKPFASILRKRDGDIKAQKNKEVKFNFPPDQDPKDRVKGPRKHVKRLRERRFNSLQTIRSGYRRTR